MASGSCAVGVLAPVSGPKLGSLAQSGAAGDVLPKAFVGLKAGSSATQEWSSKTVSNGSRVSCMQTVNPLTNSRFETLSYLPPLSPDAVAKEIDYMLSKGWIPCLEFDQAGTIFRENSRMPGYYDGRYWTLWKLPMFGCSDPAQVLREIDECKAAYPNVYIRVLGFDNIKQVQCISFIVQKPASSSSSSSS